MSNVGDALSGSGSSATGVNDQTFSDASLGDQIMGGSGDLFGGSSSGGPNSFSDVVNALSGGGVAGASPIPTVNPSVTQAASMSPPGAASATGGDPVGAASGTQSATTPGSSPPQNQQQQTAQPNQPQDHAPPSAVEELKALLKAAAGKPTGPTGPVPTPPPRPLTLPGVAAGQTGAQSPQMPLPGLARGQTGAQSPPWFYNTPMSTIAQPPAPVPSVTGGSEMPGGEQGGPDTGEPPGGEVSDPAGGSRRAEARIPPGAATQPAADTPAAGDINVHARKTMEQPGQPPQAMPFPQNEPGEVAPGGPALPTRKPTQPPETQAQPEPAASQPPAPQAAPRLLQDISGASLGSPTALADLAQAAQILLPLVGMFMGGGRRGGRRPGFQGMRGFRPFGSPGGFRGFHPTHGGHAWPYHHPQMGWHMHPFHPGPGWLPLNPQDARSMVGGGPQGGQDPNAPDPNNPPQEKDPYAAPKETGGSVGTPDQVGTSGAIPGVSAKMVDDYTREAANRYGINPDVASRVLAQESSYGQARKPGDNGTSFGPFQLHFARDGKAMGDQFLRDTGRDPRDPSTWKEQIDYAMQHAATGGWGPWTTTMKKLGMTQWSGITTNQKFAGRSVSSTQPQHLAPAAAIPVQLPPSSQPMVAGQ
jgi:hypothetical protein